MSAVRRSILFSVVDRYLTQILLIGTTAIMARLLTPAETGLYIVSYAFIMLADNFRSFGTSVYIVQATNLPRETVRSAFTVTLLLSLAVALGIFAAAEEIAGFYSEPELAGLLRIASLGFVVIPFSSPLLALMQRELAFRSIAMANVGAATVNSMVTIGLAAAGLGASSYVWGFVAQGSALAVLCFVLKPEIWLFRPSLRDARHLLSFGSISSAVALVNMFSDMLPKLAFGKLLGFDAVAIYGRAFTVCQLPDRAITSALQPVVLPAMAARARAGGDLKDAWLRGQRLMSAIQWPALAMLALLADPLVQVLLGSQWTEVPPLVRLMALAMMALAPAFMTFPVLVAAGRIRDTLTSSLISLPPSMAIVVGAATVSLEAVAASLLVTAPLQMAVALYYVRRAIGMSVREILAVSADSVVITLGTVILPSAVVSLSPNGFELDWVETAMAVFGAALGWLASIWLTNHPIGKEISVVLRLGAERMRLPIARRRKGIETP